MPDPSPHQGRGPGPGADGDAAPAPAPGRPVTLAAIAGAHGIAGEVRLKLFGDDGIASLAPHRSFNGGALTLEKLRDDGKGGAIARLHEVSDRNAAEALSGRNGPAAPLIRLRSFYDSAVRSDEGEALPLQVEVEDNGPGVPEAIAGQIFEPFVSGRENGTGLGLALAGKIVAEHGGRIGVDSRPGRTVFRLSLPIARKGER